MTIICNYPDRKSLIQALEIAFHYMKKYGGEPYGKPSLAYNCDFLQVEGTLADAAAARLEEERKEKGCRKPLAVEAFAKMLQRGFQP